jgi:hypothetical protein
MATGRLAGDDAAVGVDKDGLIALVKAADLIDHLRAALDA